MTDLAEPDVYGILTEPATLKIERLLPGPIERVWEYLTRSDLRRQWLASGDMQMQKGSAFTLTWRNAELTENVGNRPADFGEEHSMDSTITELDAPIRLAFTWGQGEVTMDLEQRGEKVLLTITHARVSSPEMLLSVSAGWHSHLDVLADKLSGRTPEPFWDAYQRNKAEYVKRLGM